MTTKIPQFTKPAYSVRLLAAIATSASRSRAVAIAHNASVGDRGSGERQGALASAAWRPRLGRGVVRFVVAAVELAPLDLAAEPACLGD